MSQDNDPERKANKRIRDYNRNRETFATITYFFKVGADDYIGEKEGVEHGNQRYNDRYQWYDHIAKSYTMEYAK